MGVGRAGVAAGDGDQQVAGLGIVYLVPDVQFGMSVHIEVGETDIDGPVAYRIPIVVVGNPVGDIGVGGGDIERPEFEVVAGQDNQAHPRRGLDQTIGGCVVGGDGRRGSDGRLEILCDAVIDQHRCDSCDIASVGGFPIAGETDDFRVAVTVQIPDQRHAPVGAD